MPTDTPRSTDSASLPLRSRNFFRTLWLLPLLFLLLSTASRALDYQYTVTNNTATITQYTGSGGAVSIPGTLDGYTVTSIGASAFTDCTSLTSVTIPDSVTTIGDSAFYNCPNMTSATIPNSVTSIGDYAFDFCTSLTSVTIPNSVTSIGDGTFFYCLNLTSVTIPDSVISIGNGAFSYCTSLTGVTIPNSVTSIGFGAFYDCTSLTSAAFTGNAPSMGWNVFDSTASGFTIYYFKGATGFTSPTWNGYTAVNDGDPIPINLWLASNGFPSTTDLKSAPNHDGVCVLMAYALNLNPNQNQSGSMPKPVIAANRMNLTYYAGSAGVTYTVQASGDMKTWSTEGVDTTEPDANNKRTASIPITGGSRFLRLVVSN